MQRVIGALVIIIALVNYFIFMNNIAATLSILLLIGFAVYDLIATDKGSRKLKIITYIIAAVIISILLMFNNS